MSKANSNSQVFYGWWNVVTCFVGLSLSYAMFTVFAFGTFVGPLEAEFGWQRGPMSLALTIANVTVAIASPLMGSLVDRIGVRRVMLVSIGLMGVCVASMSLLSGNIWHYYLMHLLIPLLGAGTLPVTYSRVIIAWFARKRGIALGISLAGFGVGAALIPPLAQYLIEQWGWREAYLAFAALILFVSLPLTALLLRETPQQMGLPVDGVHAGSGPDNLSQNGDASLGLSAAEALQQRSYWFIFGSFLLVGIGITSILAHLVPLLIGRGVDPTLAALCMSSLGIGLIVGRILAGYLMDRYFAPHVAALFLVGLLVGVIVLAAGASGPVVFLAAILIGLATGSEISEIAYIVSRYFGPKAFGLLYGSMFAAFQIGSAVGAYAMGRYYDHAGNYIAALWVVSALVGAGIVLMLMLGKYPDLGSKNHT
ncbi:MAG: MFS transporter [Halieaceae bacterium]|jgi:predicted MFS family arabinose efflux permease|nr:MFS transporter [Halieaceae bacterium]